MSRKKLIAGNWKMNVLPLDAKVLAEQICKGVSEMDWRNVEVLVCPNFTSLYIVSSALYEGVQLGAQNMHHMNNGAFTGETSAEMLKDVGCKYVILGHSERRHLFGESNEVVNMKVRKAVEYGLDPILCIGETLPEKEAGIAYEVNRNQLVASLKDVAPEQFGNVVVAYEPVWAIGAGKTPTPEEAQSIHAFLRGELVKMYGNDLAEKTRILYGGSVKPDNADKFLSQPDIDGVLVGGASLKAELFLEIVKKA